MPVTNRDMKSWKQTAVHIILLSHAVIGSPIPSEVSSTIPSISSDLQTHFNTSEAHIQILQDDEVFGPISLNRTRRNKRFVYEALKRVKQLKRFTFGVAASNTFKEIIKSAMRSVATLGVGLILFHFIHQKINQVLDSKNRQLDKLEKEKKGQNAQAHIVVGDTTAAASSVNTTTVRPEEQIPEFNAEKVSLQIPDAVFGPAFNIANGASQVMGTFVQNTGTRLAKLFEALTPLFKEAPKEKTKKRETSNSSTNELLIFDESMQLEDTPIKNSFASLTL